MALSLEVGCFIPSNRDYIRAPLVDWCTCGTDCERRVSSDESYRVFLRSDQRRLDGFFWKQSPVRGGHSWASLGHSRWMTRVTQRGLGNNNAIWPLDIDVPLQSMQSRVSQRTHSWACLTFLEAHGVMLSSKPRDESSKPEARSASFTTHTHMSHTHFQVPLWGGVSKKKLRGVR